MKTRSACVLVAWCVSVLGCGSSDDTGAGATGGAGAAGGAGATGGAGAAGGTGATGGAGGGGEVPCPDGCLIEAVCHADGAPNAANGCQHCDVQASVDSWSDNDGAVCDDDLFCTGADTCSGGTCSAHAGDPCVQSGDTCVEGDGTCCTPGVAADEPSCNGDGDVVQHDECGDEILLEDCIDAGSGGACLDAVCGCAGPVAGEACDACLFFVDAELGDDLQAGTSWDEPYATVQAGLDAAATEIADGGFASCEVWVRAGTYLPTDGADRAATFLLKSGVRLYGGFAGTEFARAERDVEANETVLSGDIGTPVTPDDNSYHVVTGVTGATIDGFTISGGRADGNSPGQRNGGGMYNVSASPTVTRCTFEDNHSFGTTSSPGQWVGGGAMSNLSSSPVVTDCVFSDNSAEDLGGGMLNVSSSPAVTGCTFSGNNGVSANGLGGGMANIDSAAAVTNCVFSANTVAGSGGGMGNLGWASPGVAATVTNCVFSGNEATSGGGMANFGCSPTVTNCTFTGGIANVGTAIANLPNAAPVVTNCIFWGDNAAPDVPRIYSSSPPTVTHSIVEGGCTVAAGCTTDDTGNKSTNPSFVSASDLRLQPGSPAIDAADGCAAPELDASGAGRVDVATVANTGRGPAVDMGAYENPGVIGDLDVTEWVELCCTVARTATTKYLTCHGPLDRTGAEAFCDSYGGTLASLTSESESNYVRDLLLADGSVGPCQIGASDETLEGTWTWATGEPWSYTNWYTGNPSNSGGDEDCGAIMVYTLGDEWTGYWNDVACYIPTPFVCEI